MPGAVVTAEQFAEVFTDQVTDDYGMTASLIEGVPEGYDFGRTDIDDLENYKTETHYLFQEVFSHKENLFRQAAAEAKAEAARILMIQMPGGITLIYRERSPEAVSESKWQIYAVEEIDTN